MKYFYIITFLALLSSCANIVAPTGGPVDRTAPRDSTELSYPNSSNNLNFHDDHFDLYFNEPIAVSNLNANINSSPALKERLDVKISKVNNKLYKATFTFNEELSSNSTYIIQLGNSIIDVTENNKAKNPTIVFSTGSYIDSLEFTGHIHQNLINLPATNFLIGLYEKHDSISPVEDKPTYSSLTNPQGNFNLTHLKSNTYKVFCFKDLNKNKLYNPKTEPIGFLLGLLDIQENLDTSLLTFLTPDDSIKINPIRHRTDKSVLTTSLVPKSIKIQTKIPYVKISPTEWNFFNPTIDSISAIITIKDSLGAIFKTTNSIPPHQIRTTNSTFKLLHPNFQREHSEASIHIPIKTVLPIEKIDKEQILVVTNSDTIKLTETDHTIEITNSNLRIIHLNGVTDTGAVIINPKAITDIQGSTNTQSFLPYIPLNPSNYGTIGATIETEYNSYFVEILDARKNLYKRLDSPKKIVLRNIPPQNYYIRILIDENEDGIYNYGSFKKSEQPEPIYYYSDIIKLKPNWEIMDISITF